MKLLGDFVFVMEILLIISLDFLFYKSVITLVSVSLTVLFQRTMLRKINNTIPELIALEKNIR